MSIPGQLHWGFIGNISQFCSQCPSRLCVGGNVSGNKNICIWVVFDYIHLVKFCSSKFVISRLLYQKVICT